MQESSFRGRIWHSVARQDVLYTYMPSRSQPLIVVTLLWYGCMLHAIVYVLYVEIIVLRRSLVCYRRYVHSVDNAKCIDTVGRSRITRAILTLVA